MKHKHLPEACLSPYELHRRLLKNNEGQLTKNLDQDIRSLLNRELYSNLKVLKINFGNPEESNET